MKTTCIAAWLLVFCSSCMGSCDCGKASPEQVTHSGNDAPTGASGAGSSSAAIPEPSRYETTTKVVADTAEAKQLAEIQRQLREQLERPNTAPLASTAFLRDQLPDQLGEYTSSGGAVDGKSEGDAPQAYALRRYTKPGTSLELSLRLVDAVMSRDERSSVIEQLDQRGQGAWGEQRAKLIANQPAIVRQFKEGALSATVLIGGRFLVAVQLRPAAKVEDLERLFAAFPIDNLTNAAATNTGTGAGGAGGAGN